MDLCRRSVLVLMAASTPMCCLPAIACAGDTEAFRQIISSQIAAFGRDDGSTAFG